MYNVKKRNYDFSRQLLRITDITGRGTSVYSPTRLVPWRTFVWAVWICWREPTGFPAPATRRTRSSRRRTSPVDSEPATKPWRRQNDLRTVNSNSGNAFCAVGRHTVRTMDERSCALCSTRKTLVIEYCAHIPVVNSRFEPANLGCTHIAEIRRRFSN